MQPLPIARHALRLVLVAGPTALAFFAGGFDDLARTAALAVAGVVLALTALTHPRGAPLLPRTGPGALAVGGLAGLAAWVALSAHWAPLADQARDDAERVALYAVVLLAACALLPGVLHRLPEALLAGTVVVVGWGLLGRLLPGVVHQHPSLLAGGRLDLPLTYWNGMGALAAFGLVLGCRLASSGALPRTRALAAAAAVPLAAGLYLTFSRGAIAALGAGLLVLLVLTPTWSQLRAVAIALECGAVAAGAAALAPAVRQLRPERTAQGLGVLLVLLAAAAAAAALTAWAVREEGRDRVRRGRLPLPSWAGTAALPAVLALIAVPVLAGTRDTQRDPAFGASNARLASVDSRRQDYWRVALRAFAESPARGAGSGSFAVEWLRERPSRERVRDAHSLPLETLGELGAVGFGLLACFAGGVALAARRLQAADPAAAAGPIAALVVLAVHASLDWDWELPALTLPGLLLAGAMLGRAAPRRA